MSKRYTIQALCEPPRQNKHTTSHQGQADEGPREDLVVSPLFGVHQSKQPLALKAPSLTSSFRAQWEVLLRK